MSKQDLQRKQKSKIQLSQCSERNLTDIFVSWMGGIEPYWRPPTDVFEQEGSFVVVVELAGMDPVDFQITLEGNLLKIYGLRQFCNEKRAYYQMEIQHGKFATHVTLPFAIQADKISANYKDGFLRVILPKVHSCHIQIDNSEK